MRTNSARKHKNQNKRRSEQEHDLICFTCLAVTFLFWLFIPEETKNNTVRRTKKSGMNRAEERQGDPFSFQKLAFNFYRFLSFIVKLFILLRLSTLSLGASFVSIDVLSCFLFVCSHAKKLGQQRSISVPNHRWMKWITNGPFIKKTKMFSLIRRKFSDETICCL